MTATRTPGSTFTWQDQVDATLVEILRKLRQPGFIDESRLADGAVTNDKVDVGAITGVKIADGTVTAREIKAGTITANEIKAGSITGDRIKAETLTGEHVEAGTITAMQIATGSITATQIMAGAITATQIAAGTITANLIAAATITGDKIAANTITAVNIAAATITAGQIAAGTITATQIAAGTITAGQIMAGTITAAQIAAGTITGDRLVAGTITATQIASGAITATQIATGAVTSTKISVSDLSAISANMGSITAGTITGGLIRSSASGARHEITASGIRLFDSAGNITFFADTSTGRITTLAGIGGPNLAWNSSFEDASLPGVTTFQATIASSTAQARHGVRSLQVTSTVANNAALFGDSSTSHRFPVTPGERITVSAWVWALDAATNASVGLAFFDSGGTFAPPSLYSAATPTVIGAWTRVVGTITVPAGAVTAGWTASISTTGIGQRWLVESVQVERGDLVTAYGPKPDEILPQTIGTTELGDSAVTNVKIVDGTITGAKLIVDAITAREIATDAVTTQKILARTILAGDIVTGTLTANEISAGTITGDRLVAGTITATQIAAGAITATQIAAGTITTTQIAANTITAADIVAGTITTTEIAAGTITAADIATATITTTQIAAATIVAGNIAAGTITASQIAANTITAGQIAAGTITATQIATGTITATQLATNSVTAVKILAGTITGDKLVANTITAAQILAGTITATELAAGAVTATKLSATAIDGKTITGATIQNNSAGLAKTVINDTGFFVMDSDGNKTVKINESGGSLDIMSNNFDTPLDSRRIRWLTSGSVVGRISTFDLAPGLEKTMYLEGIFPGAANTYSRIELRADDDVSKIWVQASADGGVAVSSSILLNSAGQSDFMQAANFGKQMLDWGEKIIRFPANSQDANQATVNHDLGVVPEAVTLTRRAGGAPTTVVQLVASNYTSTTFTIDARSNGVIHTSQFSDHDISWIAVG